MWIVVKKLFRYVIPHKWKLGGGVLCLFASAYLAMTVPAVIGMAVDQLNTQNFDVSVLYVYIGLILGLMCAKSVLMFWARSVLIGCSRLIEHSLRHAVVSHLMQLSLSFYDRYKTGDLMSRLMQDLEHLRAIFGPGLMYTMNVVFLMGFALVHIARIDAFLALCIFALFFVLVIFLRVVGKYYYQSSQNIQEELSELSSFVAEHLRGIRVIKAYAKEMLVEKAFRKLNRRYIQKYLVYGKLHGLFRPVLFFLVNLCGACVIWIGGKKVIAGEMSVGTLIQFLVYIDFLSSPSLVMGFVIAIFYRGVAANARIDEILSIRPEVDDSCAVPVARSALDRSVEFRGLSFVYPGSSKHILRQVSFRIDEGEKVAIIGPTGCGKSMLLAVLLRLYLVPENTVFVGGMPIEQIPLKTLRDHISCVPQEHIFFQNTIYENIQFGQDHVRTSHNESYLSEVARIACIDKQIASFPEGYNTYIGEGGVSLSGGQKQRLSISRALVRKAGILVLDDSFSSVDTQTESTLLDNIYASFPDTTIIIVAHRPSTIQCVDKVVVLNEGRVEDIGSPKHLQHTNSYYAYLLRQHL